MLDIAVAGLDELEMLAGLAFTRIISIHDAYLQADGGYERRIHAYFPRARVVFSYFDDVDYPTENGPRKDEIGLLLDFSSQFNLADKILIHCRAGISRSTALAYAVFCQHSRAGREAAAFAHIRQIRPQLLPNRLVLELADGILKRKGRLAGAAKINCWEAPS